MKICLLSYNHEPYIGGIETYSKNLYDFLKINSSNVKIISGKITKFKIFRIFEVIIRFYFENLIRNYDIVHITNLNLWPVLLVNYLNKSKSIFVINLHGLEVVYGNRSRFSSKLYEFLVPYNLINRTDNIYFICNSHQTLELASKKIDIKKLTYIPMGIDKVNKLDQKKKVIQNEIFFIGRITKRKGLSWFCNNVLINLKNTKLFFAGPIIDKDEFDQINSFSSTEYLGIINEKEKTERIQTSFFTIIPNLIDSNNTDFEGFGITLLEVVAKGGLPILTKTQGLITSSLNGKIGISISSNDPVEWMDKINELNYKGLEFRNMLIYNNQKLVSENFMWKDIFNNTFDFYKKITKII